ncbi:unnamed protein product [Mesocestoides corti]|uniref:Secreted protein n=1 Tax=Mesocestoides corti TaxID=53468 RepID=A0A0R3URS3_MESCO|nr:unnamed protein product [Mesocestoides corti]
MQTAWPPPTSVRSPPPCPPSLPCFHHHSAPRVSSRKTRSHFLPVTTVGQMCQRHTSQHHLFHPASSPHMPRILFLPSVERFLCVSQR